MESTGESGAGSLAQRDQKGVSEAKTSRTDAQLAQRFEDIWEHFLDDCVRSKGCSERLPNWLIMAESQLSCLIKLHDQPEIVGAIERMQNRLARHNVLIPHPRRFLHLTVRMFGEASSGCQAGCDLVESASLPISLDSLNARLQAALTGLPSFPVVLRGVNSWPEAPFIQVFDGGGIERLRERIAAVLPHVADRSYPGGFVPHVTLGYYHLGIDLSAVAEEIARLRDETIGEFTPTSVELVWGRGPAPYPELVTVGEYPLGQRLVEEP